MTMRRWLLALPPLVLAGTTAHADEAPRFSVDTGVSVGYANNPFSQPNGGGDGYVTFDISPRVVLVQERSTLTATVAAQVQQYFARYPTTDSYRASLDYSGRPAERITTFVQLNVSSAILGNFDNFNQFGNGFNLPGAGESATPPATPVVTPGQGGTTGFISDLGFFGTRERRRSVYANAGLTAGLSARDTITVSAFGDFARFRNFAASNYDGFGGNFSYSRQLSTFTQLGVQGSYSRFDYQGPSGITNSYSIQATGSTRINARWTADGALGVTFIDSNVIGSSNRTSLSGNIRLCRQSERSNMCFYGSRQSQATGFNGAQYVTSAGVDFDRRLSERSRVGLSVSYVNQGGLQQIVNGQSEYLVVSPTYSRQILERLQFQASLRYRQLFGGFAGQQVDYGGQAGISYSFGRLR